MTTTRLVKWLGSSTLAFTLAACNPAGESPTGSASAAVSPVGGGCNSPAPGLLANALCVCDDFAHAGRLITHAPANGAASVGVNGRSAAATGTSVEGDWAAYDGLAVAGLLDVRDNLTSTKDVSGAGTIKVGRDLSVGGNFTVAGQVSVAGMTRVAGSDLALGGVSGKTGPYSAPAGPPCGCAPSSLFDVAAAVEQAKSKNDNAAHNLPTSIVDAGASTIAFSTGTYYFEHIASAGSLRWTVDGKVAIYIKDTLAAVGDDAIELKDGAQLDLYVAGTIAEVGRIRVGVTSKPSDVRIYLGGDHATLAQAGDAAWTGMLYAPTAVVAFAGRATVNGALFAKDLAYAGDLEISYSSPAAPATCPPGGGGSNGGGGGAGGSTGGGGSGGSGGGGGGAIP